MITTAQLSLLLTRLLAVAIILYNFGLLVVHLIASWDQFNPTYWWFFVETQILQPFVFFILGFTILCASKVIARRLSKDIS